MDVCRWFKIEVIYPLTSSLTTDEEISEIDQIRLRNDGIINDYETGYAYLNLLHDPIRYILPKTFLIKGRTNKKNVSEIVFASGTIVYANEKPDKIYEQLNTYAAELPEILSAPSEN